MTRRAWTPRRIDQPAPGWFRMALVRGAWAVPCSIAHDEQTDWWTTTVDGVTKRAIDPVDTDAFTIWHRAEDIAEWRFDYLTNLREWCLQNAPDHPCLHPRKAIDPMRLALIRVPETILRLKPRGDDPE